jgi:hypothetical protein
VTTKDQVQLIMQMVFVKKNLLKSPDFKEKNSEIAIPKQ